MEILDHLGKLEDLLHLGRVEYLKHQDIKVDQGEALETAK